MFVSARPDCMSQRAVGVAVGAVAPVRCTAVLATSAFGYSIQPCTALGCVNAKRVAYWLRFIVRYIGGVRSAPSRAVAVGGAWPWSVGPLQFPDSRSQSDQVCTVHGLADIRNRAGRRCGSWDGIWERIIRRCRQQMRRAGKRRTRAGPAAEDRKA
eukprot:4212392-Prymnesium_polylepis.1